MEISTTQAGNATYATTTKTQTITVEAALNIRRVTTTGAGNESGSSWANASQLQAAIAASTKAGNQVWIAAGTYKPHADDRTATFTIPEGVLVYGGFAGNEADDFDPATTARMGAATILSGDLMSDDGTRPAPPVDAANLTPEETAAIAAYDATRTDNSNTVVTVTSANVTLNGLTITAGEEGTLFGGFHQGAGLYVRVAKDAEDVSLMECTFTNNRIPRQDTFSPGGGAYLSGGGNLQNCVFKNNTARFGGGLAYQSGDVTLTNCVFINNNAIVNGGGTFVNFGSNTTMTNCVFANNVSGSDGGAAVINEDSQITNCTFYGNRAVGAGGSISFTSVGNANVVNSIFTGNLSSSSRGRQLDITGGGNLTIDHNVIEGGDDGVGILESRGATVTITNTLDESDASAVFYQHHGRE